jgi:flagellin
MSVVISTNSAAIIAANNLAYSSQQLQKSLNKLSSGSKIVSPADDAGGLAVSMKLQATINRESSLQANISDTASYAQTQDGALQVAGSILDRISQLKTLASDPTKNTSDIANYNDEFAQLQSELNSLGNQSFNGISLFATSAGQSLAVAATDDLGSSGAVSVSQQYLLGSSGSGSTTALSDFSSGGENSLDSTKWLDAMGTATVSGGVLSLGNALILSRTSFTGPFEVDMQVQVASGNPLELGSSNHSLMLIEGQNGITSGWNDIKFNVAADGTATLSVGGVQQSSNQDFWGNPLGASIPWNATSSFNLETDSGSPALVKNLTVTTAGGAGTPTNVESVASATSLGSLDLATITSALQDVASMRAINGAEQSRLGFASTMLTTNQTNLQSAISNISDVDVASETTRLAKWNVLVQAGTSMLSQANQSAQMALKLITG